MKVIILSGACKSGKTYLLNKVRNDLKGSSAIVYDMDVLEYWKEDVPKAVDDWDAIWVNIVCDEVSREKMASNIAASLPWERLVKQKTITLLARGENSLIIDVLDRVIKDDSFYEILAELFDIKIHFIVIIPSFARYCINLRKRKDKKTYLQTWDMKKKLEKRKEMFDEIIINSLFFGVRRSRKKLVDVLGSV